MVKCLTELSDLYSSSLVIKTDFFLIHKIKHFCAPLNYSDIYEKVYVCICKVHVLSYGTVQILHVDVDLDIIEVWGCVLTEQTPKKRPNSSLFVLNV